MKKSRNEAKKELENIIQDNTLTNSQKDNLVIETYSQLEQGYGGRKASQLAKQIENETNYNMNSKQPSVLKRRKMHARILRS
ncbi:MAG: hypothetical protein E7364_02610 [Clostridiales bacterium]|nr:hypothetical protein [Clostridiales bacterium]